MHAEKYFEEDASTPYSFPCMFLQDLPDCGQKHRKHVVDDNLMYRVLKFEFAQTINTDIHFNIILTAIPNTFFAISIFQSTIVSIRTAH
jgi:hypothetical protein